MTYTVDSFRRSACTSTTFTIVSLLLMTSQPPCWSDGGVVSAVGSQSGGTYPANEYEYSLRRDDLLEAEKRFSNQNLPTLNEVGLKVFQQPQPPTLPR